MRQKLNVKVYSAKIAKELAKFLKDRNVKELKGDGRFKVIASCESVDRDGEVIMADGWDFTNYIKNPVILWGHNYWDMNAIIGACDKISVEEIEGVKCLVQEGLFANTPEGQKARQLYDDGMLKTVSVGFIPKERNGNVITKQELLELSFCAVPSNPDAVSLGKFAKDMMTKTLEILTGAKAEDMDALVAKLRTDLQTSVDTFVDSMGGEDDEADDEEEDPAEVVEPVAGEDDEEGKKISNAIIKELNKRFLKAKVAKSGSPDPKTPPKPAGEEGEAKQIEDLKAKVTALEAEQKSGRVLSAKNLELVDAAIAALKVLRDASEPEKAALNGIAKDIKIDAQGLIKVMENIIKNSKILTSNL